MDKQILDEYTKLFLEKHEQKYTGLFLHPEAGRDSKLNENLNNIKDDLNNIDNILIESGRSVDALLENTINRLGEIKKCIITEKERYQDIQMLCNKYTDFDNIKGLDNINFKGNGQIENGVYSAAVSSLGRVQLGIIDINGNGYEGNRFVYNDYEYQEDTYDTSNRKNITDGSISTYYEYSRITVQNIQEDNITYFNKDSEKARCTISFQTKSAVNFIELNTEDLGINILGIQYSYDGVKYQSMNLPSKISINNKLDSYKNYGYVYGSNFIAVPLANFFKITLESDRNKDDTIAYEKTIINEDEVSANSVETVTSTYVVSSAKRSAIKINDLNVYKKTYATNAVFLSEELITAPCYSIGVFANIYVPESLPADSIQMILTVNGIDYEIEPVNSHSNGTKIIRFSGGKSDTAYTELISEKITSAKLTITIRSSQYATPYVNNIKVLIGDEI
jgi:hypothetical protein